MTLAKTAKIAKEEQENLNALRIHSSRFLVFLGGLGDLGERYSYSSISLRSDLYNSIPACSLQWRRSAQVRWEEQIPALLAERRREDRNISRQDRQDRQGRKFDSLSSLVVLASVHSQVG
jgi:hypothetical protein